LSSLPETLKRRAFWVIAHVCFKLYRWFPVLGSLRASIAILYRDGKFLVIHRNDGRGVSLPGGIASRGEHEEVTVRREVLEETGMSVTSAEVKMRYHSNADVPCDITVFRAEAIGDLKESWEGSPRWMTVEEIEARMLRSQHPVLTLMKKISESS
jgi:8-oxo-dGTP pyrophosphatase MutT (NUDIX family)